MHMELVKKDKISKEEGLSQDMVILEGGNPGLVTKRRKKKSLEQELRCKSRFDGKSSHVYHRKCKDPFPLPDNYSKVQNASSGIYVELAEPVVPNNPMFPATRGPSCVMGVPQTCRQKKNYRSFSVSITPEQWLEWQKTDDILQEVYECSPSEFPTC